MTIDIDWTRKHSVVSVSYWSLIKGIAPKICMFCPNSVLLNLLCVYAGLAH